MSEGGSHLLLQRRGRYRESMHLALLLLLGGRRVVLHGCCGYLLADQGTHNQLLLTSLLLDWTGLQLLLFLIRFFK